MITISVRKAEADELNLNDIVKVPIIDALKVFWQKDDNQYYKLLKYYDVDYQINFKSVNELMEYANNAINKITNELTKKENEDDMVDFDFKARNFLESQKLKSIKESEFLKITLTLKDIGNENILNKIIKHISNTPTVSLLESFDYDGENKKFEIICHKKGAFYYCGEPFMGNVREHLNILENFQSPKDNNFILARFVADLARKLKEDNINETFCVNYNPSSRVIKSVDEVIECAEMNLEEKAVYVKNMKNKENIESLAKEQAKSEIKDEINARRNSLSQKEAKEVLENAKSSSIANNDEIDDAEFERLFSPVVENSESKSLDEIRNDYAEKIDNLVEQSIQLYGEKEIQKAALRVEKANKEKDRAYEDLKKYLDNGLSILEAIQNIKQKYSEDTVHLASLLFSKDILNVKSKDEIMDNLNADNLNLKDSIKDLNEKLDKKDETISSLRSTMQKKVIEIQNLEYELKEEFKKELEAKEAKTLEMVESYKAEQEKLIGDYENEITDLENENKELIAKNKIMEDSLKDNKKQIEAFENNQKEFHRLQGLEEVYKQQIDNLTNQYEKQISNFKEQETKYEKQISDLREQVNRLLDAVTNITSSSKQETKNTAENESKRVVDILGPVPKK